MFGTDNLELGFLKRFLRSFFEVLACSLNGSGKMFFLACEKGSMFFPGMGKKYYFFFDLIVTFIYTTFFVCLSSSISRTQMLRGRDVRHLTHQKTNSWFFEN
jgi:hypothetical protein